MFNGQLTRHLKSRVDRMWRRKEYVHQKSKRRTYRSPTRRNESDLSLFTLHDPSRQLTEATIYGRRGNCRTAFTFSFNIIFYFKPHLKFGKLGQTTYVFIYVIHCLHWIGLLNKMTLFLLLDQVTLFSPSLIVELPTLPYKNYQHSRQYRSNNIPLSSHPPQNNNDTSRRYRIFISNHSNSSTNRLSNISCRSNE